MINGAEMAMGFFCIPCTIKSTFGADIEIRRGHSAEEKRDYRSVSRTEKRKIVK